MFDSSSAGFGQNRAVNNVPIRVDSRSQFVISERRSMTSQTPPFRMTGRTRLMLLLGVMLLAACAHGGKPGKATECAAPLPTSGYYPVGALDPSNGSADQFYRQWFNIHLGAMGESPITCNDAATEYRFLWLRTFHHPVVIRVAIADHQATLHAVELDGKGGYEPGKVLRQLNRSLSTAEVQALEHVVTASNLRETPSVERSAGVQADGARWVLEMRDRTDYRVLNRQSPSSGAIREFGMHLLSLTGWSSVGPVY